MGVGGAYTFNHKRAYEVTHMKKYFSDNGESPVKDNAVGRPLETDKAWLAGIFDGEGSLCFGRQKNRTRPFLGFHITNSDLTLLGKCQMIIQVILGHPIKLYPKKLYPGAIVKSILKIYTIDLRKQSEVYKILQLIEPYLTSKRRKANLVLDFLKIRLEERKQAKYSNTFSSLSSKLMDDIISNRPLVETEREALREEMKPQSVLYGNIERSAEMTDPL